MTLAVPRSSVQRGASEAGSDSAPFTGVAFSATVGPGIGGSVTRGLAAEGESDAGGSRALAGGAAGHPAAGAGVAAGPRGTAGRWGGGRLWGGRRLRPGGA